MPFDASVKKQINQYMTHIPDIGKIEEMFVFIKDDALRMRIVQEFYNARYIYKFFEGMNAKGEMLTVESRMQVIMFANIYEAVLHYILFTIYKDNPRVKAIQYTCEIKKISIKKDKAELLKQFAIKTKNGETIDVFPSYVAKSKMSETQIRFDSKAKCAEKLGLIDSTMRDFLIELYGFRNGIHLHAELRKGIVWDIKKSKDAYWKVEGFVKQIKERLKIDKKI